MKKPDELKATLIGAVKSIRDNPERLTLFVDKGRVGVRLGSLNFEYRYSLNIVVEDFAGSVDQLTVPILGWIAKRQPELLQKQDSEPFTFETEILAGDLADVSIYIDLSERVRITPGQGGVHVEHLPDALDLDAFEGVCGVRLTDGLVDAR